MIDPTTGQEQPHPLESMIESTILQNEELKEQGSETNALLEAIALQTQENDPEPILGAMIENDNQNTEKLVGAIKELKPELEKSASSTDRMVNFLEQMKGEKGDKGDKGDIGERGEKGDTGEKGEQGIEGKKGDKGEKGDKGDAGKNGKDGSDGIDGSDGKDGKDGKKGKDGGPDTGEEIVTKLSKLKGDKRLDKSAIKGLDKMQKEIDHIGAFGSSGQEYRINGTKVSANSQTLNFIAGSNTTITGTPTSDGANITITATGGGGSGTVDSVVAGHGIDVDATDPANPIVAVDETELTHNSLGGLQGGTTGQYNHLTDAQVSNLHAPVTVSDSSEIDLTLTGQQISASIVAGSIDESKLDTSVNASLDLADTAVQPAGLAPYELLANKSTSTSLGTSDTLYPSQNAVKTYVDNSVVGLLDDRGNYDASGNVFPSTGGSGTAGAILKGDLWIISVAGTLGGSAVEIGDQIRALVDTPGQTAGNWAISQANIGYVPENVANKSTDGTFAANSDTLYPSQKAAKTYADTKAPIDNPTFTTRINVPEIKATGAGGVDVHNNGGTQVALFGAGGSTGSTLVGTTNIGSASSDYHQVSGGTGTITDTATGSSSNININLIPKGTGRLQEGGINVLNTNSVLDDLSNVQVSTPNTNDHLAWNGSAWIPVPTTQVVGSASVFYLDNTLAVADNKSLSITPSAYAETTNTASADADINGGVAFLERFVSGSLGRTTIPAGVWDFSTFAKVSAVSGANFIETRINKRVEQTGMTATFTGAGATRTLTVTGGTPFVAGDVGDGTVLTETLVETPNQTCWISGFTSSSKVTVTLTDSGYVNESGVSLSALYYLLFRSTSSDIASTGVAEVSYNTTQPEFTGLNDTDRIVVAYFGRTTSATARNFTLYHGGSVNYSHFHSPLTTQHNDLAGLNNGDFKHLTSAEYTGTGTGNFVRATSPVLTTPNLGTPSALTLTNATGLPIAGLAASTSTAIGVGSVELGHASDTTLSRSSAGNVAIEGNVIYRAGGTDVPVSDGGTGVSTLTTAYGLLAAGTTATGAIQTLATGTSGQILRSGGSGALPSYSTATYPATAGTSGNVLTSDGTNWVSSAPTTPTSILTQIASSFETSTRFSLNTSGSGANTFGTSGLQTFTNATSGSFAGAQYNIGAGKFFDNNPIFSTIVIADNISGSGSGSTYWGIGSVVVAGAGHTYTEEHIGFKALKVSSTTTNLYGTVSNGTTETATASLTTVTDADVLELICVVTGTSNVAFYWRKNGGSLSSATNITTNIPSGVQNGNRLKWSSSNNSTAVRFDWIVSSFFYQR